MNYLFRLLCCISFLNLSGCATYKTQNVNQCKAQCVKSFESCKQLCSNSCSKCSTSEKRSALSHFLKYAHEEQLQGGAVTRDLNSYRDPLQCRKVTCNCYADLMTCNQGCTSIVQKSLQSVPYCT